MCNNASSSPDCFTNLETGNLKIIKPSLKAEHTDTTNFNNIYKSENNNKEPKTSSLYEIFINKRYEVENNTTFVEHMNIADKFENVDTINIVDDFKDFFNIIS